MPEFNYIVPFEQEGERIDIVLSQMNENLSRSYVQKLINDNKLQVNGITKKASYKLKENDNISFSIPESIEMEIEAQDIPIDIIYEDEDVAIVNKPRGMVVHPSNGHDRDTLVNALLYRLNGRLSGINGVLRPGIVHRIDKDTSGLLIICKNDLSHNNIAAQLKDHTCMRTYHAIVHGNVKDDEGTIHTYISRSPLDRKKMAVSNEGKEAITHYKVLKRFKGFTYIECKLETGRTHQIRVHMAHIGHPLYGDPVYSTQKVPLHVEGQMLHAKTIGFKSLKDGEFHSFDSELPDDFNRVLKYLNEKFPF